MKNIVFHPIFDLINFFNFLMLFVNRSATASFHQLQRLVPMAMVSVGSVRGATLFLKLAIVVQALVNINYCCQCCYHPTSLQSWRVSLQNFISRLFGLNSRRSFLYLDLFYLLTWFGSENVVCGALWGLDAFHGCFASHLFPDGDPCGLYHDDLFYPLYAFCHSYRRALFHRLWAYVDAPYLGLYHCF